MAASASGAAYAGEADPYKKPRALDDDDEAADDLDDPGLDDPGLDDGGLDEPE